MCRNIHTLYNFEPPATDEEIHAASLQYVRKVSGFTKPSQANQAAFDQAVEAVTRGNRGAARPARHQRGAQGSRDRGGPRSGAGRQALRDCPTARRLRRFGGHLLQNPRQRTLVLGREPGKLGRGFGHAREHRRAQSLAFARHHQHLDPPVAGTGPALDQTARLQPVDDPGDVGCVAGEAACQPRPSARPRRARSVAARRPGRVTVRTPRRSPARGPAGTSAGRRGTPMNLMSPIIVDFLDI